MMESERRNTDMVEEANIHLTNHAYSRMKERLGLGKKAADRLVQKVFKYGIIETDVTGRLSEYLMRNSEYGDCKACKFLYGEHVFVFVSDNDSILLVTVYRMNASFKGRAASIQRRLRNLQ